MPSAKNLQPGSYRYFAQEWGTFMCLCDDTALSYDDLSTAFSALGHLLTYSEEASDDSPNTLEMLMRAAFYKFERTLPDHPIFKSTSKG